MANLSLILPVLGSPDSTEDVKLNNALTAVQAWANGNVDVDNLANGSLGSVWSTYTPTWTVASGTPPVLGNGVLTGNFLRLGKAVFVRIFLAPGTTTTFGTGNWQFALPAAAKVDGTDQVLMGFANPVSINVAVGIIGAGASVVTPYTTSGAAVTLTSPAVWSGGAGQLTLAGVYETV